MHSILILASLDSPGQCQLQRLGQPPKNRTCNFHCIRLKQSVKYIIIILLLTHPSPCATLTPHVQVSIAFAVTATYAHLHQGHANGLAQSHP